MNENDYIFYNQGTGLGLTELINNNITDEYNLNNWNILNKYLNLAIPSVIQFITGVTVLITGTGIIPDIPLLPKIVDGVPVTAIGFPHSPGLGGIGDLLGDVFGDDGSSKDPTPNKMDKTNPDDYGLQVDGNGAEFSYIHVLNNATIDKTLYADKTVCMFLDTSNLSCFNMHTSNLACMNATCSNLTALNIVSSNLVTSNLQANNGCINTLYAGNEICGNLQVLNVLGNNIITDDLNAINAQIDNLSINSINQISYLGNQLFNTIKKSSYTSEIDVTIKWQNLPLTRGTEITMNVYHSVSTERLSGNKKETIQIDPFNELIQFIAHAECTGSPECFISLSIEYAFLDDYSIVIRSISSLDATAIESRSMYVDILLIPSDYGRITLT
jgi:hypothetical protein